jgi:hypothetical protein
LFANRATVKPFMGGLSSKGSSNPSGSKIYWENGATSEHLGGFFRHVGKVDEADAPPTVMHKPEPVTVLALRSCHTDTVDSEPVNWSIRTPQYLLARMEMLMPGDHSAETMRIIHGA